MFFAAKLSDRSSEGQDIASAHQSIPPIKRNEWKSPSGSSNFPSMELLLLGTVGMGLAKVWSQCCSANFAAGVIGNLLASIGYEHVVKNPTEAAECRRLPSRQCSVFHFCSCVQLHSD
jgi:hypothetical protein